MEGAGRHGPLPCGHAVRELGLDQPAAAPADGVGPDVEAGTVAQGREGTVAEGSDAGAEPEQGRGVERDAQACPGRLGGAQVVIAPSMERIAPVM